MNLTPVDPTDDLAVLKAAREWLRDPEHWTMGTYWRDSAGQPTASLDHVMSTCVSGAISFVIRRDDRDATDTGACKRLQGELQLPPSVVNDDFGGYRRVCDGLDRAIATLEAERAA